MREQITIFIQRGKSVKVVSKMHDLEVKLVARQDSYEFPHPSTVR